MCDIGFGNVSGRKAILIAGPTAGGKSAFALRLAERHGGIVINADSMAVYRDLSILTGRPDPTDLARIPHELYGHRDGAESYSVGHWLAEADTEIRRAWADGALPIVVGGTGLYFKALTQGLSHIPPVPPELRMRIRAEAEGLAPGVLHARLAARDPATAALVRPTDPQRILRAWEILEATGRPLASFRASRSAPLLPMSDVFALVLSPDRADLRRRIDERFDRMMAGGALDEVEALARRRLSPALPVMRALGVPPLLATLGHALSLDAAVARSKTETRAYAKRQVTFARHQLPGFDWTAKDEMPVAL